MEYGDDHESGKLNLDYKLSDVKLKDKNDKNCR